MAEKGDERQQPLQAASCSTEPSLHEGHLATEKQVGVNYSCSGKPCNSIWT